VEKTEVRELWGVQFRVVPEGLEQAQVVAFVDNLLEQNRKSSSQQERQTSLIQLAEQTVVEADKIAESIKEKARLEAEEETAKTVAAAEDTAREQAERIASNAERETAEKSTRTLANAQLEAQEIIASARKDSQDIIQSARDLVPGIKSDAKLEAEYILRKFTAQFVEELRSLVMEKSSSMLPNLDDLLKKTGHVDDVGKRAASQPAITFARRESK
jgi:vacuolar-type H+-ATPase subunit H